MFCLVSLSFSYLECSGHESFVDCVFSGLVIWFEVVYAGVFCVRFLGEWRWETSLKFSIVLFIFGI